MNISLGNAKINGKAEGMQNYISASTVDWLNITGFRNCHVVQDRKIALPFWCGEQPYSDDQGILISILGSIDESNKGIIEDEPSVMTTTTVSIPLSNYCDGYWY